MINGALELVCEAEHRERGNGEVSKESRFLPTVGMTKRCGLREIRSLRSFASAGG